LLEQARVQLRKTNLPAWEFPRILSLDELAAMLSGFRKISRVEQEVLLEKILADIGCDRHNPCFAGIVGFPGFVAALARLFDELKMAAVTPDELEAALEAMEGEAAEASDRDAAIAFLFRRYQEKMVEYSLVDIAGTYLLAVEALAQENVKLPFERIFMAEFSVLSPVRLQLIAGLQRWAAIEIGICYEKNRPELFAGVEPVVQALMGLDFAVQTQDKDETVDASLDQIQRHLFEAAPPVQSAAPGLQVLISPTRTKETAIVADQIKAWLLSTRRTSAEIALVVKDPALYPQLSEAFEDRGIPLDIAEQSPVAQRAFSRLLFAWLDMVMSSGRRPEIIEVIKSPYLRSRFKWDPELLEKLLLPEVLSRWEDWDSALLRQAPDETIAKQWLEDMAELRDQAGRWTQAENSSRIIDCFQGWLQWLDFPATLRCCRKAGILGLMEMRAELSAWQQVTAAVTEMENIFGWLDPAAKGFNAADFSSMLRRLLNSATVDLRDRQDSGVQVVTPGAASGMKFPVVFILGLTEGEFPAQPRESWLYSDSERRLLAEVGIPLSTAAARSSMEDFNFALSAAMATEALVLSAVTDGETLPSRYVDEISRLFAESTISQQSFGVHQVVAEVPEEVKSRVELLRSAVRHHWQDLQPSPVWQELYNSICVELPTGLETKIAIERNRSGPYAGEVRPELVEPGRLSASALERYASCPFVYFVTDMLALSPWQEAEEGLDALSAGSIWHEILAAFMAGRRGEKLVPAAKDSYVEELGKLLDHSIGKREQQGRLVSGAWWQFERPRWLKAIRRWLQAELDRQAATNILPRFFEWSFGMTPRFGSDGRSTDQPLVLGRLPGQIELQGKIDRIDSNDDTYRVIDYKTGRLPVDRQVRQGLCLQVPVYMMAVEELLYGGKLNGEGAYSSVGQAGKEFVLPGKKDSREELLAVTREFVLRWTAGIRSGAFPARPGADCPPYCIASAYCRFCGEASPEGMEETPDE
jgi:ATP-dependent helicase/DNAse subunit B